MPSLLEELPALLAGYRIRGPSSFELWGQCYTVDVAGVAGTSTLHTLALERLADLLYSVLHCRLTAESWAASIPHDPAQSRDFVERLARANCGTGPWQGGWIVRGLDPQDRIVAERLDVRFSIPGTGIRSAISPPTAGSNIFVRVPKEYRHLIPGFYMALGDADDTMTEGESIRVYWNVRASGAEALVGALTSRLNEARVPFWLKLANSPQKYQRSDAAVLYLPKERYAHAERSIASVHAAIRSDLRDRTSALAHRLARGLAVAEDPGNGESFGQHRSRLLAGALMGLSPDPQERLTAISDAFSRAGIDLQAVHLSPRSTARYRPLAEGSVVD
jgi:hypothetical protein